MARKSTPIIVSEEDLTELKVMSGSQKLDHRYVVRSRIILDLYSGKTYDEVERRNGVTRRVIAKWKSRFLSDGLRGLLDKKGRGRKAFYTEADRSRIVQKACEKPEGGYTNWSQRRIARELGWNCNKKLYR